MSAPSPLPVPITDPDDPRIAHYRAVRERDVTGRGEKFVAEGEVVLRLLLSGACRHGVESVLVTERRIDGLDDLLSGLPDDAPLYVASQAVMDQIVGFHIHRGVLAIGLRAPDPGAAALLCSLPERAMVVALSGVSNHDNVGGIFRNAAAFGADAVLLDGACCDPLYRKAIRVSVGAGLTTPFSRGGSGGELLDALYAASFETIALSPGGSAPLAEIARGPRTALLLGAEGPGLPADLMARTTTARVDMAPGFDSLNVAVTSGVALYELTLGRHSRNASHET